MQRENNEAQDELGLHHELTDELFQELVEEVAGQRVVSVALWEESLADEAEEGPIPPEERTVFDLDLYLENHRYLELYGVQAYRSPEADPLQGLEGLGRIMADLVEKGLWLEEVATDQEERLVLVLTHRHEPQLYLNVAGWVLEEWESLPED